MLSPRRFIVLAVALAAFIAGPAVAQASHEAGAEIDVCCSWNSALADGELTYKVKGSVDQSFIDAATDGVEAWDAALGWLTLTPVAGRAKADITVTVKRGGSPFVAGQANRKFQRISNGGAPFFAMKGASISIFGARPGSDIDDVEGTSAHEVGHALGAGHANVTTGDYLMEPVLNTIVTPQACDIAAVAAAQAWHVAAFPAVGTPAPPTTDHVHC